MSEQLIKTPKELAEVVIQAINNYCPAFGDHKGGRKTNNLEDCPCNCFKSDEYLLAKAVLSTINSHTALLAVAEAAEAYFLAAKDLPLGITVSVGEWTAQHNAKQELSAKLSAWRKQG